MDNKYIILKKIGDLYLSGTLSATGVILKIRNMNLSKNEQTKFLHNLKITLPITAEY